MWKFTKANSEIFCFPGLWDRADTLDGVIESFTILTCAPGADCEPYHNRQPVILEPEHWATWLDLSADPSPILRAGAAESVAIERALEATLDA